MMTRGFIGRNVVGLVTGLCLVNLCLVNLCRVNIMRAYAQENAPSVLQYHRITIPAIPKGRIDEVGGEFLPYDRDKFQKTVAELNAKSRALYGSAKPNIVQARYTAKFENRQLVSGSAELDIKHPHSEPAFLPLSPLGLAVDSFRWKSHPASEAEVGLLLADGAGVFVSRSDTLTFLWSLRGTSGSGQEHRFRLSLPKATASELLLDLPQGVSPECADAIIGRTDDPLATNHEGVETTQWRIELGATHETELRIVPTFEDADRDRLVMARPTYDYRIGTTGLELRAAFRVDVQHQPLRHLTLHVDPRLRLAAVQLNGQAIGFAPPAVESDQLEEFILDLPTSLVGGPHELAITGYAPVVIDKPWQLPSMRLVDVQWRQGNASLDVVEPLRIGHLSWQGSLLRGAEPLPSPATGESRQFDLLRHDAVCEVLLTRQQPQLRAQTGTTITLNESIIASQFIARLSASGGAVFSIPLQRDAGWIVDSIETDPPQIDRVEVLRGTRGLKREIILREPIRPNSSLKLIVKAHRRILNAGAIVGDEMRPITLGGDLSKSRLTAVRAELPLQLDVTGDASLRRVTELSAIENELVDGSQLVFRDGPDADGVRVVLRSQPPRYSSEITAEALVEATKIRQSFVFRCQPMSSRVGTLRVRFSPRTSDNIQWSAVGEGAGGLTATRLEPGGNEWEVRLGRLRPVPFEVRATLTRNSIPTTANSPREPETIVLASLPDAESQVGTISMGTPDGTSFSLQHEGLRAIPTPAVDAARMPILRSTYRYAPAQDVALQLTRRSNPLDTPDAWIWSAEGTSQVDVGGEVAHAVLLRIENVGVSHLTVDLPENATWERVDVDGERIDTSRNQAKLRIPLPPTKRFPAVRLRYQQAGTPLGNYFRGEIAMPTFDLRCLNRSWRVWLPPGYQAVAGDESWQPARRQWQPSNGTDWERRLLGFSILRRTGKPWNLSSLWDWQDQVAQPSRRRQLLSRVEDLLGAIDAQLQMGSGNGPPTVTWRTAMAQALAATPSAADEFPLYLDREALSDVGISPTSLVPTQAKSASSALRLSELVFVGDNNSVVLTTLAAQAAGDYGSCSSLTERTFITKSIRVDESSRFVLAGKWIEDSSMPPSPWGDVHSNQSFTPLVGWTYLRLPASSDQVMIVLYRNEMADTIGWASLFVAVACGIWLGRRSPVSLLATVVVAIIAALLVPISLVFVTRSMLLGLLAGGALLSLRRQVFARPPSRRPDESLSFRLARRTESVTAGLLLAVVLFAIASNRLASAQERAAPGKPPAANVFRVYDPVDEDGQPVGPHIYVSRKFFESLETLKMSLGTQQFGAILTAAKYSFATADAPMATMLPELLADFELVSLSAGLTTIQLPFVRDELQLSEAVLDEQRVYPRWSEDGETLELDVDTLGRHRLRLTVRPVLNPNADRTGFNLRIPTIPNSRLSITGRHAGMIEPTSGLGAITRTDDSVEAKLGMTNRLAVSWSVSGAPSTRPLEYTASQLIWVHAESQVITLDTQLAFSILSGTMTEVELLVDPRLQLLATDNEAQVTETLTPDHALRKIRYRFDRAYEENELVTIKPSFIMTDIAESGIVKRPLIRVASGVIDKPLLAISTSPGIAAAVTHEGDWPTVRPQDFAETWGTMQLPREAVQLPTNESDWSLAVMPLAARLSSVDATEVRIGRRQAAITYDSEVRIADATVLQLVFATPVGMIVESVSVLQDDVDLVRRYSKSPEGTTTIFLTGPVQGDVRVAWAGTLSIPLRGSFAYTGIRLADSDTSGSRLTVLRRAGVLVEAPANSAHRPADLAQSEQRRDEGDRLVGVYDMADPVAADITFVIAPNPARFSGRLVTALHSEDAQWAVTADLSLQVSQGVVDSVRVRVPRELIESLRLDPPLPFEVQAVPGQSEPNVIITPPAAIDKELQVSLHARLQTSPDGSISAPAIELLDTAQVDRLLVLPKRSAEQEIEWDIRGLEQPESDESQTTYRVRGQRMRAVVREVNQSAGSPRLLLADIEVAWQLDESYVGVASFDLEPGALANCDLVVPEGVELLHATVDDVPALLQFVDARTATLELGAERLPQQIAILFAGHATHLATEDRSLTLAAPSLRGLQPRTTLWSVRDPSRQAASVPQLTHTMIGAAAARHLRVGILQETLNYNIGPVPQHRSHDLQRWRERWQQRLNDETAQPGDANSASLATVVSLRDGMNRVQRTSEQDDWTYCSFDGETPTLTIIRRPRDLSSISKRVAMSLAIGFAAWLVWKLSRREGVRDAFSRWPHLPGVVIGLAWWLWLAPSFVGWLIAALFLASSLRPIWHPRRMLATR